MGKPNYRVLVAFDSQRAIFTARAPELEHLSGDGATRRDAVCKLEEEIDAQLANMLSLGSTPPKAIDEDDFSGEVNAKISRSLHRDLAYLARTEGVEVDQIVSELLSAALALRQGGRSGGRGNRHPNQAAPVFGDAADDIGNRADGNHRGGNADGNRADGNRRGGYGRGYNTQLLDDRANFIEYIRNQENNPGGGHGRPGGHHGGGGHNNHNNNNNNNRGRRRRGGGQGNGPNGPQQHGRDGGNRMHGRPEGGRGPGGPQNGGSQHGGAQHGGPQHGASAPQGSSGPSSAE